MGRFEAKDMILFHLEARWENRTPKMKPPQAIQSEKICPFCSLLFDAKILKRKGVKDVF
jgi:hypothetical protein